MPLARGAGDRFTYSDYLTWSDEERWELLDGEPYAMTPAPTTGHQRVVGRLYRELANALEGGDCIPFVSPVDVVLSESTVVQPDVVVVCDRAKIRPEGIFGAPDLVVEVLSPSTGLKDRGVKRDLYERYGVREYVLLEPEARYGERFALGTDGKYGRGSVHGPAEIVELASLQGLRLRLWEVFEVPGPPEPGEVPEGSAQGPQT